MTHEEAFLQAIREAPDDDGPRLIYADWLEDRGDPRGEFIRVQCARARLAPEGPDAGRLAARAWRLLDGNWEPWIAPLRTLARSGPAQRAEGWLDAARPDALSRFPRGFIVELGFDAGAFAAATNEALRLTVLQAARVYGAGPHAPALAASPRLTTLEALRFADYYDSPLDARGAAALAGSPHLGRLTSLFLGHNNVGDAGAEALSQAPWLMGLRLLDLTENGLSEAGFRALVGSPYLSRGCTVRLMRNAIPAEAVGRLVRVHGYSRSQFPV